jgi:hypothetical protein
LTLADAHRSNASEFIWQPFSFPPVFWQDKFSPPQSALVFSRDGLPRFHPFVVRHSPPVAHHLQLQIHLSDETISTDSVVPSAKDKAAHWPIANHLPEKLGRLCATRIKHTPNPAFLIELRCVHATVELHFRSVSEDQQVCIHHFDVTGDPFQTADLISDDGGKDWGNT